jgi:glycosyltransferase involved in cell wall biosynthesis
MIHVLHLIDTYRIGGPGKTVINSARMIDPAYQVHVAAFTHPDERHNEFARAVVAAGIPFLPLPETKRFDMEHVRLARRYIREHRVTIVHAHGYKTDAFGYAIARRLPVCLVTTHHGWIRNTWYDRLTAFGALQLTRVLAGVEVVSPALLAQLPASVRRSGRAEIVKNGIVTADYEPQGRREAVRESLGCAPGVPLLGVVGRLSPEKGCLDMIAAFAALADRRPAATLAFIGEGPQQADLAAEAARRGLADRVLMLGHRPVPPLLEALDVLVSPSHTEGISNAILEALTAGVPVVATRVGGTPEIVSDEVSGLLVPPADPPALAAAIARVLDDPGLAARLRHAGRARIDEAFSFEARMRTEEAFYRRVCHCGGREPA